MDRIDLTSEAVINIRRLQEEYEAPGFGLRFGLRGGGCSGYKYILELESEPDEQDLIFERDGVQVFVHPDHMDKLKNSTIGWKENHCFCLAIDTEFSKCILNRFRFGFNRSCSQALSNGVED